MDEQQNPQARSASDILPDQPAPQPAEPAAQPQPPAQEDGLAEAKARADEYMAGWKRAMADYANLKKEMERAGAELAKYAAAGLVEKLLPAIESFRKAEEQRPDRPGPLFDETRAKQWIEGVSHVRAQLESALASAGVAAIDRAGIPFDPAVHEAMMMQRGDKDHPPGTVAKVLEPGWKLHDRVIRPAKVVVTE